MVGLDISNQLEPGTARRAFYERGVGLVEEISTSGPVYVAELQSPSHFVDSTSLTPVGGAGWSPCPGPAAAAAEPGEWAAGEWAAGWAGAAVGVGSGVGVGAGAAWAGGAGLPLLQGLPLLSGVVPLPAVLDDRLLLPRGLVLGGLLLVPLLLVLVGRAVAGHRGRRGPAEGQPRAGHRVGAVAEDHRVGDARDRSADQRRDDEQPELDDRVASGEDPDADGASRVDRGAGEVDRREVDHREGQADRGGRQGRVLVAGVGDGEDHVDEDRGQDDLDQECRPPRVAGAVVAEAVLGQPRLADVVAVDALDQDEQREAGDHGARELGSRRRPAPGARPSGRRAPPRPRRRG